VPNETSGCITDDSKYIALKFKVISPESIVLEAQKGHATTAEKSAQPRSRGRKRDAVERSDDEEDNADKAQRGEKREKKKKTSNTMFGAHLLNSMHC
jgi:hypothetical protein